MKLQGKVAVVTGAAKRVGRAIAGALAQRGARLAIHYNRSRREAQRLADEIKTTYDREAVLFKADLSNAGQVRKLGQAVLRRFGDVHVLVHSASAYERTPFEKAEIEDWDAHLETNLRAPFFLSQTLGPAMKKAGEGKIIHLADWAAKRPYIDYIPYCVSKAGLLCLNAALAKALAPEVQVNAVLPGPVLLPEGTSPKLREAIRQATPVKRLGNPEDVVRAVLFLIEGSDFVTGAELAVDGGRLIA
ncbi:MAG: SDR family oxidoreductase [Elusimicrobia bacterium]|nr:SDR family oxidoreductase [Elusimicrobiota bacterium]